MNGICNRRHAAKSVQHLPEHVGPLLKADAVDAVELCHPPRNLRKVDDANDSVEHGQVVGHYDVGEQHDYQVDADLEQRLQHPASHHHHCGGGN